MVALAIAIKALLDGESVSEWISDLFINLSCKLSDDEITELIRDLQFDAQITFADGHLTIVQPSTSWPYQYEPRITTIPVFHRVLRKVHGPVKESPIVVGRGKRVDTRRWIWGGFRLIGGHDSAKGRRWRSNSRRNGDDDTRYTS